MSPYPFREKDDSQSILPGRCGSWLGPVHLLSLACAAGAAPSRAHPEPGRLLPASSRRFRARRGQSSRATAAPGESLGRSARRLRGCGRRVPARDDFVGVIGSVAVATTSMRRSARDRGETAKPRGHRHAPGPTLPLVPAREGRITSRTVMRPPPNCQQENEAKGNTPARRATVPGWAGTIHRLRRWRSARVLVVWALPTKKSRQSANCSTVPSRSNSPLTRSPM